MVSENGSSWHLPNVVIFSILRVVIGTTLLATGSGYGKIPALIMRGVLSSLRGVVIGTTLLATGSGYGTIPALITRGVTIHQRSPVQWVTHGDYAERRRFGTN